MATQQHSLSSIITLYHGVICTMPLNPLYDLMEWMTGERPFTTQLGRFADECKPYLREQLTWIDDINSDFPDGEFKSWWADIQSRYDSHYAIRPIHLEDHEVIDPIEELKRRKLDAKIIKIDPNDFAE